MAERMKITVPDLGDFADVEIIEVLVSEGDSVRKEDGLITLETDKAAMDVPAPADGKIESLTVSVGDKVSEGDVIGELSVEGAGDANASDSDAPDDADVRPDEATADDDEAKAGESPDSGDEEPASGGEQTVEVPDIGDFSDVDVIEVHVSEGDAVAVDDPLITLETDKAAMDVPTIVEGKVKKVLVSVGDKVSEGTAVAVIEAAGGTQRPREKAPEKGARDDDKPERRTDGDGSGPRQQAAATAGEDDSKAPARLPPIDEAGFSQAHASPSVRKLARELGVDLARVEGSGKKGRILHDDVKAFVKAILEGKSPASGGAALPEVPKVDFGKFGEVEEKPLTRIQKISGPRLQASWINLPHVTQHDLADITELEAKRQELKGPAKERGISLTPLAFVMKACVAALKEFPKVNASLSQDGTSLVYKRYYHLGFAADTDNGLVVPVIRDADRMDVYELAKALGELSAAARDGKLKADQMQGASFTISSLGGIGGTAFTPIVNAPEVAILGVSRSTMQPVWNGSEFEPRLMLPLSFSYDHRVIDGAVAVRFTTFLGKALGDVDKLLQAIP
ncbi:MAG: dihydrolipoyllysine-residue acetyltransferase [Woeseiaceae bacterium]|nr:dihydrolipoyllysine-residue acetyltransferase [Woeseiaceae bacterium]